MQRLMAAALVLALASTSTTGAHAATLGQDTPEWERYWSQLRREYRKLKVADVAYKTIRSRSAYVGEIDPPFVTPDPDQVEVIAFITYGNEAWIINYPVMIKWAKTLPSTTTVHYLPKKSLRQGNPHPRAQPLRAVRQNLYQTALAMGAPPAKAHHLIALLITGNAWTLESTRSQRRYARKLRLDPEEFQVTRQHPAVRWEGQVADWLELALSAERWRLAKNVARMTRKTIPIHFPELLIGGRYVISMSARLNAKDTYRMANWAIGKSLEELESNRHWPRNAEQLATWLGERDGQILSRWMNGKHQDDVAGIVYDGKAQAIWILDRSGAVRDVATLAYDNDNGTHFVYERDGQQHYFDPWRLTRQYGTWDTSDENDAPQRHGAFLLTEHLVDRAEPITLQANGEALSVTFEAAGRATVARSGEAVPATWRLNGNHVEVQHHDGELETWDWHEVAEAAGFEMPRGSMWPWDFPQRFTAAEPAVVETPKTASALQLEKVVKTRSTDVTKAIERVLKAARKAIERLERRQQSHEQR